jgi:dTMP kinase
LPDVTLYLTIPTEVASARSAYGTERYETISMQQRVKEQFVLVQKEVIKRHGQDKWVEIPAAGTIEEVEGLVKVQLDRVLGSPPNTFERLWT